MEIDKRFVITICYAEPGKPPQSVSINAHDFFEYDSYQREEWGFDLPWRRIQLNDYIDGIDTCSHTSLQWIRLDINDIATSQRRRLVYQYWEAGEWMLEWIRSSTGCDQCRQAILKLFVPGDAQAHLIKASIEDGSFRIVGHSFGDDQLSNRTQFLIPPAPKGV